MILSKGWYKLEKEEIRLRILESVMKFVASAGPDGVLTICKKLEEYVFMDKAIMAPSDGVKEHRTRRAKSAKEAPSNT